MTDTKPRTEQRGPPWAIRGVSPEARSAAAVAAKKAGLTLGMWVDRVVRDAAVEAIKAGPEGQQVGPTQQDTVAQLSEAMQQMAKNQAELLARFDQQQQQQPRGMFAWLSGGARHGKG